MSDFSEKSVVLASGNAGKLKELGEMLLPLGFNVRSQSEFSVPEAEETGLSFVENAIIKARNAAAHTGLPALADDSGLCVAALDGAPGIYSARYAGLGASDADNNAKLLAALSGVEKRTAWFHCAAVFVRNANDPQPLIAEASWYGDILEQGRGDAGFGYDPLFYIDEFGKTSAQLPAQTKNEVSHRGQAIRVLVAAIDRAERT